ncbi:MAG: hypothetical protein KG028_04065 [Actinobacteria bacterium]|nr:hypothetical protein [Actinomycetota bacterium]
MTAVVALLALAALAGASVAVAGAVRAVSTSGAGALRDVPHRAGPGGDAADGFAVWARNDDGRPIRWDPCTPIDLVVAPAGAPESGREDLERALDEVAGHSGLQFRVVGETDERPADQRDAYQPDRYGHRWAPVLVAWAQPHENGLSLRDSDRGLAIPVAVGRAGARVYVTGQVVLNAERQDLRSGFGDRADAWGSTLLHELSHLVGLAHVSDPEQLMAVHPGSGPVELADGDRAGLAAVGADHGCLAVPRPRQVEVTGPAR